MQKIIMIHQGIVISRRQIEAGVCILRYAAVMIELTVLYALTAFMSGIFRHDICHIAMLLIGSVSKAELPAAIYLGLHRINKLPEEFLRGIVKGDQEGEYMILPEFPLLCLLKSLSCQKAFCSMIFVGASFDLF